MAAIPPLASLGNVPLTEISQRYGPSTAEAVSSYFMANPSERYKEIQATYEVQRNAVVGPAGRMDQSYYSPSGPADVSAQASMVAYGAKLPAVPTTVSSTPISKESIAKPLFTEVESWFKSAPVLSSVYELGTQYREQAPVVAKYVSTTPVLSTVYSGGQVYEGRADVARQQELASSIYSKDVSKGYISSTGEYTGPSSEYKKLVDASNLAKTMELNQQRFESPLLGKQITPVTMPIAAWGMGASEVIENTGGSLVKTIDSVLPVAAPVTHFAVGVGKGVASIVPFAAMTIPALEWGIKNPAVLAATVVPGVVAQGAGMVKQVTEDPAMFAGTVVGMLASGKVMGKAYELQPYRIGIERADIIPSSGTGASRGSYSSLAITKLSGENYQIAQINKALVGVGGKTPNPADVIMKSDLLRTTTGAKFTETQTSFKTPGEAMVRYSEVAESGPQSFYHATGYSDFVEGLISRGSTTVGASKEGALFFAPPEKIYTKYATRDLSEVPVAIRLTSTPKITPEFTEIATGIKRGELGAFGQEFKETVSKLPEGFYPGVRAAAGKSFGNYGLEEEYIVSPKTQLYLTGARSTISPSGREWLLVDVSLNKPLIPDVKLRAVQAIASAREMRPYVGLPKIPEGAFEFGSERTFAPQTPLETSIVKSMVPEEAAKINLGYGVREITSGSGMKLEQATTAIGEVVKAREIPRSAKVTEAILQTEIDYGVKMYGSSIQRGAGVERGMTTLTRPPNDIDVYVPASDGKPMGTSFASDVTTAINKAAGKTVVYVDESGTVSLKDGSGKLFDIHNENPTLEELLAQGSNPTTKLASPYYGIGMKTEPFVGTPEGIEVMTYSEQIGRKLSGVSEFTPNTRTVVSKVYEGGPEEFSVTGKILPRFEGRMKDIPDFYTGEKGNIELMMQSANPLTRAAAGKANVMLEQWLETWGEQPAKAIRENYQTAVLSGKSRYSIDLSDAISIEKPRGIQSQYAIVGSPAVLSTDIGVSRAPYEISLQPSAMLSAGVPSISPRAVAYTGISTPPGPYGFSERISAWSNPASLTASRSADMSERLAAEISPSKIISPGTTRMASQMFSPPSEFESPSASLFLYGLIPSPSPVQIPSPASPPSPPQSPISGGGGETYITGGYGDKYLILPPTKSSEIYKKKRKPAYSYIFREILPVITPIETMGGFKQGRPFYRAIGNQQILEVKPQTRDYLHYVDVDQDIRELQQKEVAGKVSDFSGMQFFRTATKAEKEKTGKPILKYTPTKQELDIAKMVGISGKSKKGKRNPWF